MEAEGLNPPSRTAGDVVHALTKGAIGSVPYPILPGVAAELFGLVIRPPIEKRMDQWQKRVAEAIEDLQKNGIRIDQLQDNEVFVSTVLRATIIAMHTHEEMKLSALKNAVQNVGKGQAPEDAIVAMFLSFVDSLTELHCQVLALFQANVPMPGGDTGLARAVEARIPELLGKRELLIQIFRDLHLRGLFASDFHSSSVTDYSHLKRTTHFGDAFLQFISKDGVTLE
jgi:hypothetical protein